MDSNSKQRVIDKISEALAADQPLLVLHKNKSRTVVLPAEDYQTFEARRANQLKNLRVELNGILHLVHTYTGRQSSQELEARLTLLRQRLKQEMELP